MLFLQCQQKSATNAFGENEKRDKVNSIQDAMERHVVKLQTALTGDSHSATELFAGWVERAYEDIKLQEGLDKVTRDDIIRDLEAKLSNVNAELPGLEKRKKELEKIMEDRQISGQPDKLTPSEQIEYYRLMGFSDALKRAWQEEKGLLDEKSLPLSDPDKERRDLLQELVKLNETGSIAQFELNRQVLINGISERRNPLTKEREIFLTALRERLRDNELSFDFSPQKGGSAKRDQMQELISGRWSSAMAALKQAQELVQLNAVSDLERENMLIVEARKIMADFVSNTVRDVAEAMGMESKPAAPESFQSGAFRFWAGVKALFS